MIERRGATEICRGGIDGHGAKLKGVAYGVAAFFLRTNPPVSKAKPACMNNTRYPVSRG
jgi:hypothetical protein